MSWVNSKLFGSANLPSVIMNKNQPPTEVVLKGLYFKFIDYLKDYKLATPDWRKILVEDLKEIYDEVLTYADVANVGTNPYYRLITHRSLNEHIILCQRQHNLI